MKVEIYRDFACAWSRLGTRRFELAVAEAGLVGQVEVVHRPFLLAPDADPDAEPVPLLDAMGEVFGSRERAEEMLSNMVPLGRKDGVEFNFDKALAVSTVHAHRLMLLAGQDRDALAVAIFDAYFRDGRDIADRAELAALAESVGIDRAEILLAGDEGVAAVRKEDAEARTNGVTSVPTFVFPDGETLRGAAETDAIVRALRKVSA